MSTISIQLPTIETDHYVEVGVTVNGERRQYKHQVEVFRRDDWSRPLESRAPAIKRMIEACDKKRQLLHISSRGVRVSKSRGPMDLPWGGGDGLKYCPFDGDYSSVPGNANESRGGFAV